MFISASSAVKSSGATARGLPVFGCFTLCIGVFSELTYDVRAVASSLSLCVANPPSVVWLRDCDQEPCV